MPLAICLDFGIYCDDVTPSIRTIELRPWNNRTIRSNRLMDLLVHPNNREDLRNVQTRFRIETVGRTVYLLLWLEEMTEDRENVRPPIRM